jgi:hypothetical protein
MWCWRNRWRFEWRFCSSRCLCLSFVCGRFDASAAAPGAEPALPAGVRPHVCEATLRMRAERHSAMPSGWGGRVSCSRHAAGTPRHWMQKAANQRAAASGSRLRSCFALTRLSVAGAACVSLKPPAGSTGSAPVGFQLGVPRGFRGQDSRSLHLMVRGLVARRSLASSTFANDTGFPHARE